MSQPEKNVGLGALTSLALDMRSSWNHGADELWNQLDPALWDLTHNPWAVLQTVSRERLDQFLDDPKFKEKVRRHARARDKALSATSWFQQHHAKTPLSCVAYFSLEFMLGEALPIYSGGLGNVAGDQLKAASDLGVPVVGIGLLYQQGYFRQSLDQNGAQQALYPYNDPGMLPVTPVRKADGQWLRLEIALPGYSVWLRAWQVEIGRTKLYLLDTNDVANFPIHRGITSELYGGGLELRLKQEILLGIGGWRLLQALGLHPDVCHLNEGHAALVVLERARDYMTQTGRPFDEALAVTRAGNLFTTHTAVPAGFDRFAPALMEQYLGVYAQALGLSLRDLLALGRQNPDDPSEPFNMAYLAIRGSGAVNAVSRLHGDVSRQLFASLFPRWPLEEIPVSHVTNGVHVPTWDSPPANDLWTDVAGKAAWKGGGESLADAIRGIPDQQLWAMRNKSRRSLIDYARTRLARQLAVSGAAPQTVEQARHIFDPSALTLGFARRFATYKRPNLLLFDPERLIRILTNPQYPVQLLLAGKAHPADGGGQDMIRQWTHFITRPEVRPHVAFLSDYDMLLTEHLVGGVDVWLNTPERPWEACGTSGMKVLVNGGLNLSTLDGWWAEAYAPAVGWAIGDASDHDGDPGRYARDARELYDRLEHEVIPEFYRRDQEGIPVGWIAKMRESMARLTPLFSASRAVRDYTEKHYLPAAERYHQRSADHGAAGGHMTQWRTTLAQKWNQLRFGEVKVAPQDNQHRFEIVMSLGDLDPGFITVELYAMGIHGGPPERHEMTLHQQAEGRFIYRAEISALRPASDFTVRVVPRYAGVAIPQEESHILWQR